MRGRVLIIDDDPEMCAVVETGLTRRAFDVVTCTGASAALERMQSADFDVVATDMNMPGVNGLELCQRIAANRADVPVIVITAFGSLDTAIAAIRAGAYDFITKPFDTEQLALALDRAIQHRSLREEVKRLRLAVADAGRFDEILGDSPAMRELFSLMRRTADSEASVLITGESGTGKELVARGLHQLSRRGEGPFVAVNCAAMPEPLLESELFGHVKGAFTDARTDRRGLFAEANGGTLFLDEIGAMPIPLQPKLLRALQERHVRPVGGNTEVAFDARLIAATNSDLESAVDEGRFRSDLFYRVNVIHLAVPPLRARGGDVLLLAQRFIEECAARAGKHVVGLSSVAAEKLLAYAWPGNVRELRNGIERAVALTGFEQITVEDLPDKIRNYGPSHVLLAGDDPTELVTLAEVERRYVLKVMDAVQGNKTLASSVLGMDRKTLYRKLDQYGYGRGGGKAGDGLPLRTTLPTGSTTGPAR